jgi:AcrR family transcriptional regulator
MEDKRVTKTKALLKQTLVQLLDEKPFEQITVKELCQRAYVSRITFYTHYSDKYALVDGLFEDMAGEGMADYQQRQTENNPDRDPVTSYLNMLDTILDLYFAQHSFYRHTAPEENPYLASAYFNQMFKAVETRTRHTARSLTARYSTKKITAFLCYGLFGFVTQGLEAQDDPETIRREAREVLSGMLRAGVLMEKSPALPS